MAGGTDGNLITYDASGDPAYVTTGTSGQVLTSGGTGVAPTFQAAAGGVDGISTSSTSGTAISISSANIVTLGNQSATSTYLGSDQTISNSTETKIQFNTELFDVKSEYDTSNYRFTASEAGKYLVTGNITYPDPTSSTRYRITIRKNGGETHHNDSHSSTTTPLTCTIVNIMDLSANDYLEIWTKQFSGGNDNVWSGVGYGYFSIIKVA